MKVLYIASSGGPGGASVALLNLIKGLVETIEIHVVFSSERIFF